MPLAAGTKLGPYEIIAQIGAGGMGEVYRGRDTKLQREVAIKVLPEVFANDPDRSTRFTREALLLASLNHPGIAQIYGVEERALIMELVPGPTLADRIASGPIPLEEALPLAAQIAEAVEYAHDHNVVHRDLKPANVKITPEGAVKVLDFGLAKALADDPDYSDPRNSPTLTMTATRMGVVLGTAAYMAPEQAKGKPVDRRADIWAFGVVLYEMLSGNPLHQGETVAETMASVILKEPKLDGLPADTPPAIKTLLRRCLEKDPKQRLQAIGEARILLRNAMPSDAEPAPPPVAATPRRPLIWIVAAAVFAIAFTLALALWAPWRKPPAAEVIRFQVLPPEKMSFAYAAPPAISPDGRFLAFVANADGGASGQIWVRSLDTLEARALPGTESTAGTLFWSPDSRSLAFSVVPPPFRLKRVEMSGGPPQTFCDPNAAVPTGAWSVDNIVLLSRGGLLRVPAGGGDCTPVTFLNNSRGETAHRSPAFLPDGRHFLYSRVSGNPGVSGIYIGSLDARPAEQSSQRLLAVQSNAIYVPTPAGRAGHLLFVRENSLMAQPFDAGRMELAGDPVPIAERVGVGPGAVGALVSASANGVLAYRPGPGFGSGILRLSWFDRQGKVLNVALDPGNYSMLSLSPDGKQVAFVRIDNQGPGGNQDIWLFDAARGASTRFTFDPAADSAPVWSPDGSRIAFASDREGVRNLYLKPATGAGSEEVLLKSSEAKLPTDWSRDGRFLLFNSISAKTAEDLWILPMTGDRKLIPYLQTEFAETDGHFSPDGRFVAYQSNASGISQIYVQPFPNPAGGKWMVSKDGGIQPRWRRDGKELYFLEGGGTRLVAVDVSLSPTFQAGIPRVLFPAASGPAPFDVSGTGSNSSNSQRRRRPMSRLRRSPWS
jgi:eukaryotic-like serine/threonine-protein kinase